MDRSQHAIPSILKTIEYTTFTENNYFTKGNEIFDIAEKKTKAKPCLILDEMCRLYGKFVSYLRRVLFFLV